MVLNRKNICSGIWAKLFFIILIEPVVFQKIYLIHKMFQLATTACFCIVSVFFFFSLKKDSKESSKIPYLVLFFQLYLVIITAINKGRVTTYAFRLIQFTCLAMYVDLVLKNNPKVLFTTCLNIITFYVSLNLVVVILFPNGLYADDYFTNNYLLGYDNQFINFILPMLVFVLLKHQYIKPCKMQVIYSYLVALITVVIVWSGMSLVAIFTLSLLAVFFVKRRKSYIVTHILNGRVFNLTNFLIFNILAWILLVCFRLQYILEGLIVGVLHKSLTLTGRTRVWDVVIDFIKKNPIFGYGKEYYTERALKLGFSRMSPFGMHAHNRFLETMYSGGIILLSTYLYMLFYIAKRLKPVRDTYWAKILSWGLFIYLMAMLTEQYEYSPFFWVFFVVAENSESILKRIDSIR